MRRRQVLGALAAGVAAAAASGCTKQSFAQSAASCPVPPPKDELPPRPTRDPRYVDIPGDVPSSLARAAAAGKPLLVLVVPVAPMASFTRASAFGELINHGSDETLAHLAACEVTCATMDDVRHVAPQVGPGDPLMVMLEPGSPLGFERLEGMLPQVVGRTARGGGMPSENEEDRIIDQRIEYMSDVIRHALAPDAAALKRRASSMRARLPAPTLDPIDRALSAGGSIAPRDADRAAAIVLAAAGDASGASRSRLHTALAEGARLRLRDHRVPGSRWGNASGCGSHIEGEPEMGIIGCGMGHVPSRSARFLDFLANARGRG